LGFLDLELSCIGAEALFLEELALTLLVFGLLDEDFLTAAFLLAFLTFLTAWLGLLCGSIYIAELGRFGVALSAQFQTPLIFIHPKPSIASP
jgi:hypothetical protein